MSPSSRIFTLALAFAATALSAVPGKFVGSGDSVGSGRLMDKVVGSNDYMGKCKIGHARVPSVTVLISISQAWLIMPLTMRIHACPLSTCTRAP